MRGELFLPTATLLGFLLTLARVSGAFVFVPLPGLSIGFSLARVMVSLGITVALAPFWPHLTTEPTTGVLAVWLIAEAALGIGMGLAVAFITEGFNLAAQVMGLQAGYAYASTIDPNTQADSGILVIFAQLAAGLLFLALGLHREVIRIFVRSLETAPPGSLTLSRAAAGQLMAMAGTIFSTGVRLALPVVAVLLLVDVSLALLGRINSQLQLLTIAFPAKMMVALAIFGWLLLLMPVLMRSSSEAALAAGQSLLAR
ncbi:MAG TPA: flagellar biosynthetic protein FliR [Bryobacteraceae bacterium]|nr:flagellar biosynthetic protein FliR [Bryobacteraceae bacterium]